jgi:hypothetical protein
MTDIITQVATYKLLLVLVPSQRLGTPFLRL